MHSQQFGKELGQERIKRTGALFFLCALDLGHGYGQGFNKQ